MSTVKGRHNRARNGKMASTTTSTSTAAPVPSAQNPLSRKLNKILESNLDSDKETLEALGVLSSFLEKNTLHARRNLRSDLEKRSLALNENFLQCVGELVEQVRAIQQETATMKICCEDMNRRLAAARTKTSGLLKETSQLQTKTKQLEMKSKVVDTFLDKFELKPEELNILSYRHGNGSHIIGEEFFRVMEKVKGIHENCKSLLRTSQQRAGLEIMELMAMHLESAYEQLYHWTQNQCRTMSTDLPETNPTLRSALKELQQRPILLQYCIDEYSIARRMALVRCFIDALTREGSSGRPIELHSHDPVRYCSDMLGWLHQAIATENDHIISLLAEQSSEKAVAILSMVTEGACRPLHMRIEQVIVSTMSAVVAYKLVNLLRYYAGVLQGHLGPTAPLVQTVNDLSELQSKMFFSTLNAQTSKILESMEAPLPDLSPTPKAAELLSLLQNILASRDMTVLVSDNQEQDLKLILSSCIDPLIQYCNESAGSLSRLERAVYLTNCLYLIQSTISLYEFTERQVESLEMQLQSHLDNIVADQGGHLISSCDLLTFHAALKHGKLTDEHFKSIEGSLERVNELMSSTDHLQLPQWRMLTSARLRDEALKKSVAMFLDAYESVFAAIVSEKGEEIALKLLPYKPQQTRQLMT